MIHSYSGGRQVRSAFGPQTRNAFAKATIAFVLCTFIFHFNASAQRSAPGCSIAGPLQTSISRADLVIHVKISHSTGSPEVHYDFATNTSRSVIRAIEPLVFDKTTNSATQEVIVTPGPITGTEFNLELKVVTPNGTAECSTSVSIIY